MRKVKSKVLHIFQNVMGNFQCSYSRKCVLILQIISVVDRGVSGLLVWVNLQRLSAMCINYPVIP